MSEFVVITNNDFPGVEILYQEILDIGFRVLHGKVTGKGHHHDVVYALVNDQLILLFGCAQQSQRYLGVDDLSRMGVEGDEYAFPVDGFGRPGKLLQYLFMAVMYAVKGTDRDDGIPEFRQYICKMKYHGYAVLAGY